MNLLFQSFFSWQFRTFLQCINSIYYTKAQVQMTYTQYSSLHMSFYLTLKSPLPHLLAWNSTFLWYEPFNNISSTPWYFFTRATNSFPAIPVSGTWHALHLPGRHIILGSVSEHLYITYFLCVFSSSEVSFLNRN